MPIITISRGSYSRGKKIAEELALRLGYECISRDILIEASDHFNIPEVKLVRALHDAPSVLERFSHGKERYIAYIRKALLEHVAKDNIVYHGLAGHFLLQGIPHVLKVRIISNFTDRIQEEMRRENITEEEARKILHKDDEERRKWSLHLYGVDTADASLYDIVLHIDQIDVDAAVDILAGISARKCFQATDASRAIFNDALIAARAHAALVETYPNIKVTSNDGLVCVNFEKNLMDNGKIKKIIGELLDPIDGVKGVWTNLISDRHFD